MNDSERDDDFVIAPDGEIIFEGSALPLANDEAPLDIVDGHHEINVDDLTIDISDDYGG
jgi:hypothetical protein